MRKFRKHIVLLLGLLILLLSMVISCSQAETTPISESTLITYTNDDYGYTISYPSNWHVQVMSTNETDLLPPQPYRGFIGIYVVENPELPVERMADGWLIAMTTIRDDFVQLDSKRMQGLWDWYLAYDFMTEYGEEFHGETYFKQTDTHLYKIETAAETPRYDAYTFDKLIPTFKLLSE